MPGCQRRSTPKIRFWSFLESLGGQGGPDFPAVFDWKCWPRLARNGKSSAVPSHSRPSGVGVNFKPGLESRYVSCVFGSSVYLCALSFATALCVGQPTKRTTACFSLYPRSTLGRPSLGLHRSMPLNPYGIACTCIDLSLVPVATTRGARKNPMNRDARWAASSRRCGARACSTSARAYRRCSDSVLAAAVVGVSLAHHGFGRVLQQLLQVGVLLNMGGDGLP